MKEVKKKKYNSMFDEDEGSLFDDDDFNDQWDW